MCVVSINVPEEPGSSGTVIPASVEIKQNLPEKSEELPDGALDFLG